VPRKTAIAQWRFEFLYTKSLEDVKGELLHARLKMFEKDFGYHAIEDWVAKINVELAFLAPNVAHRVPIEGREDTCQLLVTRVVQKFL
jgi:hypothetical protein